MAWDKWRKDSGTIGIHILADPGAVLRALLKCSTSRGKQATRIVEHGLGICQRPAGRKASSLLLKRCVVSYNRDLLGRDAG